MSSVLYHIPTTMIETYRGRTIIVRSHTSAAFSQLFLEEDLKHLAYIQFLAFPDDIDTLVHWGIGVPVELFMSHPETEFPRLYRYSKLLDTHPVRVAIPVVPGFSKAVKVAGALHFAVKLETGQPDHAVIEEMTRVLDFYLHHSTVSQPIEYFQSMLLAFYHHEPISLWTIQEEDPAYIRYITDQGEETISRRFVGISMKADIGSFVERFTQELLDEKRECSGCEFLEHCGGYFKWPQKEFRCEGVKTLFHALKDAARELRNDLGIFRESREPKQP